jgi:hypothetical protein
MKVNSLHLWTELGGVIISNRDSYSEGFNYDCRPENLVIWRIVTEKPFNTQNVMPLHISVHTETSSGAVWY